MDTFITYDGLPLNAGGAHNLGKQQREKIYADTLHFIENFTVADAPVIRSLIFYSSQKGEYKTFPAVWQISKEFGIPSYGNWKLSKGRQHFFSLNLSAGKTAAAFQILKHFSTLPGNGYGP